MGSRLINVRLDESRLRKVRRLREHGVALSDVVREAIDTRFEALTKPVTVDAAGLFRRIIDEHPDPADLPPRAYDVHNREAARRAIGRALKRRRSR